MTPQVDRILDRCRELDAIARRAHRVVPVPVDIRGDAGVLTMTYRPRQWRFRFSRDVYDALLAEMRRRIGQAEPRPDDHLIAILGRPVTADEELPLNSILLE